MAEPAATPDPPPVASAPRSPTGARHLAARARQPRAWAAALVLAVAGLVFTGGLLAVSIAHYDSVAGHHRKVARVVARADLRAAAVAVARRAVTTLLTVRPRGSSEDLAPLLAASAPGYRDQLGQEATAFRQALTKGRSSSTGSVAAAGLVGLSASRAVVAVAAKGTVKNSATPGGEPRNYRLTVTLVRVGPRWLVADLAVAV